MALTLPAVCWGSVSNSSLVSSQRSSPYPCEDAGCSSHMRQIDPIILVLKKSPVLCLDHQQYWQNTKLHYKHHIFCLPPGLIPLGQQGHFKLEWYLLTLAPPCHRHWVTNSTHSRQRSSTGDSVFPQSVTIPHKSSHSITMNTGTRPRH